MDNFSFVPFPLASLPPSGLLLVAGPTCIVISTFALVSFQQLPILMFSISLSISAKIHKIKCQSDLFLPWEVTLKVQLSSAQALFSLFPAHLCSNSNVEILVGPLCLLPGTRGQHRSHNKIPLHPTPSNNWAGVDDVPDFSKLQFLLWTRSNIDQPQVVSSQHNLHHNHNHFNHWGLLRITI